MWHLVQGLCESHDDHTCLSVTPVQSSIQVTNPVIKELNQLGFARPLTAEAGSQQEYFQGKDTY